MQIKPFLLGTGIRLFTILIVITLLHLVATATVNAANGSCTDSSIGAVINSWKALDANGNVIKEGSGNFSNIEFENATISSFSVSMDISNANVNVSRNYELRIFSSTGVLASPLESTDSQPFSQFNGGTFQNSGTFRRDINGDILGPGNRLIYLYPGIDVSPVCFVGSFTLSSVLPQCTEPLTVYRVNDKGEKCYLDNNRSCADPSHTLFIEGKGIQNGDKSPFSGNTIMDWTKNGNNGALIRIDNGEFALQQQNLPATRYSLNINLPWAKTFQTGWYFGGNCETTFEIINNCKSQDDRCNTTPPSVIPTDSEVTFDLCKQTSVTVEANSGESQYDECVKCFNKNAIWTAVGCIETKPQSIIQAVVKIGVGIGGGIALLMTLVGGFLLTTSQGDPKRTQEGKEMITSSVIGILFVLFSVVILQFIGVTIFRIPGFGL